MSGNLAITYEAYVVDENGPYDRVSDLNCFWMATDPEYPEDFKARSTWRAGKFSHYYSLKLYYAGYGGHDNTKTRFSKYDGNYQEYLSANQQPEILKEYLDSAHLIKPNTWHKIEIICHNGRTIYKHNGEVLFDFTDKRPYEEGYFGFRTVENHLKIRNFKITQLK